MGKRQSREMITDEWITPLEILNALGPFDLDPCAPIIRPWDMASHHYTILDNGLIKPWFGRIWLNPPYGSQAYDWLELLAAHGNGIALIFARIDTQRFFETVWERANALLFIRGRLYFHYPDGKRAPHNSPAPSVLVAYGQSNVIALRESGIDGKLIIL
jgi:hypothetical protein